MAGSLVSPQRSYFINMKETYTELNSLLGGSVTAGAMSASATFDPASRLTLTEQITTIPVAGCVLGDFVYVSFSLDLQGFVLSAYVSVAGTVSVAFFNATAGTIDLGSGTLRVVVVPKTAFGL